MGGGEDKGSYMGIRRIQHHRQLLKYPDGGGGAGYGVLDGTWGVRGPIGDMGGMGSWMGHGGYGVLDIKREQSQHHGQLLKYPDGGGGGGKGSWMGIQSSQHHGQLLKCPDVGWGGDPGWDMGGMGSYRGHGG